jgi:predicted oxidoreductase
LVGKEGTISVGNTYNFMNISSSKPILSSPIAGCMRWGKWGAGFSAMEYEALIKDCIDNGITSFDHADIYGDYTTEEEFGRIVMNEPSLRQNIQLITKAGIQLVSENRPKHQIKSYNTSAQHLIKSVEQSLKNFRTDYIDVFLIHRPNPLLNPNEVAFAISKLKEQGKILSFGVSNFLPNHINQLISFVSIDYNQLEFSIVNLKQLFNGSLDNCLQHGIVPMGWAPLGGGILTDETHPRFRSIEQITKQLAEKYSCGANEILLAFILKHPANILPVVGSTKIERLVKAKKAKTIVLTDEEWFMLLEASKGEEVD